MQQAKFKQQKHAALPQGETLRMLRNKILVRPIEVDRHHGLTVVDGRTRKPQRCVVVAVGPGKRPIRRYKNEKGEYYAYDELPGLIPTELQPGDEVELVAATVKLEVVMAGETHYIVEEDDAAGVLQ